MQPAAALSSPQRLPSWLDDEAWQHVALRDGDIIIATYPRSGTTWTQQIVLQLLSADDPHPDLGSASLWMESSVPLDIKRAWANRRLGRRVFKSHLDYQRLPKVSGVQIINVGRDARDVAVSHYDLFYKARRQSSSAEPLTESRNYIADWLKSGPATWPLHAYTAQWWDVRNEPNVTLLHYQDLKKDLGGQIQQIADHLSIALSSERHQEIIERCTFQFMKANAERLLESYDRFVPGASRHMINLGESGRWRTLLSLEQISEYEATAFRELGEACATWLMGSAPSHPHSTIG